MKARKCAELVELIDRADQTPKQSRRLARLVAQVERDYVKASPRKRVRQLIALEAAAEAEEVDQWAIFTALRAEQSLVLLKSLREKRRARLWIASDKSPWGTDRLDPVPDTLTITKDITARQKAKRATRRYAS